MKKYKKILLYALLIVGIVFSITGVRAVKAQLTAEEPAENLAEILEDISEEEISEEDIDKALTDEKEELTDINIGETDENTEDSTQDEFSSPAEIGATNNIVIDNIDTAVENVEIDIGNSDLKSGEGYVVSGNEIKIVNSDKNLFYKIKQTGGSKKYITIDRNIKASVEIISLNITSASQSPVFIHEGAALELYVTGNNILTGPSGKAGIYCPEYSSLALKGNGTLTVKGGTHAAGIGGSQSATGISCNSGDISIESGVISATGGAGASASAVGGGAGIGGARNGKNGVIEILGGDVTAIGGASSYSQATGGAAGIGSGNNNGNTTLPIGEKIIMEAGAIVQANGGDGGAGIGCGTNTAYSQIIINGGDITATGGQYGAGIGGGQGGGGGNIFINGGEITAFGGKGTKSGNVGGGAGIGSGRSGSSGKIEISGGFIQAQGGQSVSNTKGGAGIGGGFQSVGEQILIKKDSCVIAKGGGTSTDGGAGIGGGYGGGSGSIKIEGGEITATGAPRGSGIGGASGQDGGTIIITGGKLIANGGKQGSGIGGGYKGGLGDITIKGTAHITAQAGSYGAGIGSGDNGKSGGSLLIEDGEVRAFGGNGGTKKGQGGGAGIGSGRSGNSGTVTIIGGIVESKGGRGGNFAGAGIGSGENGTTEQIVIGGSAQVRATSSIGGAGIGGGATASGGSIIIGGSANAYALSESMAAGIGGGRLNTTSWAIEISGQAEVEAYGSIYGAGIGSGWYGSGGDIQILGGTVYAVAGSSDSTVKKFETGCAIGAAGTVSVKDKITISENADITAFVLMPKTPTDNMIKNGIFAIQDVGENAENGHVVNAYFEEPVNKNNDMKIRITDPDEGSLIEYLEIPKNCYSYAYTTNGYRKEHHYGIDKKTGAEVEFYVKEKNNDPLIESTTADYEGILLQNLKDCIEGTLWRDSNGNGIIDDTEQGIYGAEVKLWQIINGKKTDTKRRVLTDGKGKYQFYVGEGIYIIEFPHLPQQDFTVRADEHEEHLVTSVADINGESYQIEITGSESLTENQIKTANAGYLGPNTDNNLFFEKNVYDELRQEWVKVLQIDKVEEKHLTYQLQFTLPLDMSDYNSLSVQDILTDPDLELETGALTKDIEVLGMPQDDTYELKYDPVDRIISCDFKKDKDTPEIPYQYLAGKTIVIKVYAIIKGAEDSNHEIINHGKIVINESLGNPLEITKDRFNDDVKATVQMTGKISGFVFIDKNQDGIYTTGKDTVEENVPVKLYESGSNNVIDTYMTKNDGSYEFEVVLDRGYYIEVPTSWNLSLLMTKSPGINDINRLTGRSDVVKVTFPEPETTINAGYEGVDITPPEFTHYIKRQKSDGGYEYLNDYQLVDTSETLTYELRMKLPKKAEELKVYETLVIEEVLDDAFICIEDSERISIGTHNVSTIGTFTYTKPDTILDEDSEAKLHTLRFAGKAPVYDDNGDIKTAGYDYANLADEEIVIEVDVKVNREAFFYTSPMINKGTAYVNGGTLQPSNGNPEVTVTGAISGTIFDDRTGNKKDKLDEGDGLLNIEDYNETIILYKDTYYGLQYVGETVATPDGTYSFAAELNEDYVIEFPLMIGNDGLIIQGDAKDENDSHANVMTGYSDVIHIDDYDEYLEKLEERREGTRFRIVNAGYIKPDTEQIIFSKMVRKAADGEAFTSDKITVTDKKQELEYKLCFNMPTDIRGIQNIILQDILPEGLVLSTGVLEKDVSVTIITGNTESSAPITGESLRRNGSQIIYYFPNHFDFSLIADADIEMIVKVKLDSAITDFSNLKSLKNTGQLIINGDINTELGTKVNPKGSIQGTLFDDSGNRNNTYDEENSEAIQKEMTVKLYQADASGAVAGAALTEQKASDGFYAFKDLDVGERYVVEFSGTYQDAGANKGLISKGSNTDPLRSHVNTATGRTDIIALNDVTPYVRNAGYAAPIINENDIEFTKILKDAQYDEAGNIVLTDVTDTFTFEISLHLPADLNGYQSIEIRDLLPKEMVPADTDISKCVTVTAYEGTVYQEKLMELPVYTANTEGGNLISFKTEDIQKLMRLAESNPIEVVMEVTVKLASNITDYPEQLMNQAELWINGTEDEALKAKLDMYIGGEISGIVFEDIDGSSTYTKGDILLTDVEVGLWDASGTTELRKTKTNQNGAYQFCIKDAGTYQVKFPASEDTVILVTPEKEKNELIDSHAKEPDGYTEAVTIERKAGSQKKVRNAGYVDTSKDGRAFHKYLVDETGEKLEGFDLSDVTKPIYYKLSLRMPDNMSKHKNIELQDILPVGLRLPDKVENCVEVTIEGVDKADVSQYGTLSYDSNTKTIRFVFDEKKVQVLGGRTVTMLIKTELENQTEPPSQAIINKGILVMDEERFEPDEGNPEIKPKGMIRGTVFPEGAAPAITPTVKVELYEVIDGKTSSTPIAEQTVSLGSSYQFIVPIEDDDSNEPSGSSGKTYVVKFQTTAGGAGLIPKGTGKTLKSHADENNGYTAPIQVTKKNRIHEANAGYKVPEIDEEDLEYKKLVKVGNRAYELQATITDRKDILTYQISLIMPTSITGMWSMELIDELPIELELTGSLQDKVKVILGSGATEEDITGYGSLTQDPTTGYIHWLYVSNRGLSLEEMAGQPIRMELETRIRDTEEKIPEEIKNRGVLKVNGEEVDPDGPGTGEPGPGPGPGGPDPEPGEETGTIKGTVFEDSDNSGDLSSNDDKKEGIPVYLYKSGEYTAPFRKTTTDEHGEYTFTDVEVTAAGVDYEVAFPKHIGTEGLIPEDINILNTVASHARRLNGYTAPVPLKSGDAIPVLNAGYRQPDVSSLTFAKQVKGKDGSYTGSLVITDLNLPLEYKISFKLDDTNGYYYLQIQDQLPKELELCSKNIEEAVAIMLDGTPIQNTNLKDAGTLEVDENGLVTYTFRENFAYELIAGCELTMELKTQIKDEYKTDKEKLSNEIKNEGKLIINKYEATEEDEEDKEVEVDPEQPPVVNPGGIIRGYVWNDKNMNGLQDEEWPLADQKVVLQKKVNDSWKDMEGRKYTTQTGINGEYLFVVEPGIYRVKFPWISGYGMTKKWSGGAGNYEESHEDSDTYLNRISDDIKVKAGDIHKVDAGYITLELPGRDDFKKYLVDEAGNKIESVAITDPVSEVIKYRIDLKLGDLSGYDTIEIIDELDPRFELQVVSLQIGTQQKDEAERIGSWTIDKNNKFTYIFKTPLDKSLLENKMVSLYLNVTIRPNVESLENITNIAYYVINGDGGDEGEGGDSDSGEQNPNVELEYGYIEGWVWLDKDKDSLRDEKYQSDTPLEGAKVILEQLRNRKWIQVGEAYTDKDGHYIFIETIINSEDKEEGRWTAYPYGSYRIRVSHNEKNMEYVTKWKDNYKYDGIRSDVNANGVSDSFTLNSQNKYPKPSAGLKVKEEDSDGNDNGNNGGDNGNNNEGGGKNPPGGNGNGGNGNGNNNGGGSNNGSSNGNNTKDEEKIFKKMPLNERIYPGKTSDFSIKGFGNDIGKDMQKYSITDIFPEGLSFEKMKMPAFTKSSGIAYEIRYRTNKTSSTKTLLTDVPADKVYTVKAPKLDADEWITHLMILIDTVPPGFGIGDEIIITCRVDDKPPTLNLVNRAALGFNGIELSAKTQSLSIGEAPKTGDSGKLIYLFLGTAIASGIILIIAFLKRRKKEY